MLDKIMFVERMWFAHVSSPSGAGASFRFTPVILIRGRSNGAHYDPDPTGTMTESDESNTIMSAAPCHAARHAGAPHVMAGN